MTTTPRYSRTTTGRAPIQIAALVVAAVFGLVGVLGFVPGVTSDFDSLGAAGHESHALLLGIFQVSVLHNVVHPSSGCTACSSAMTAPPTSSR